MGRKTMKAKRIIPCLDVHNGRVVKGINFADLKDAGDPVEMAGFYASEGADELVFLDISATNEGRGTIIEVIRETAGHIGIPLIVGGGIASIDDMERILSAGASKVSISSAAVNDPRLIAEGAKKFGSNCIIIAIDAGWNNEGFWEVYINGGRKGTGLDAVKWAQKAEELGAGEILLTSMDRDGTRDGYDLKLTAAVSEAVSLPVIASGGAGNLQHLHDGIIEGKADAVLCASIFHNREYSIAQAKKYLRDRGVNVG